MITLSRFGRTLTILLCLLYFFTGSGLDRLTYQCISLIHRSVVFPCKGTGCQCDKAGYELPNCQCDHENKVSCCSIDEEPVKEESCCTEQDSDLACGSISNIPCQGVEESKIYSLAKHLLFLPHFEKPTSLFTPVFYTPSSIILDDAELQPIDKVPIHS